MTTPSLKEQIIAELDNLSPEQQRQMLEYAKRVKRPPGVKARTLLKFAGRIQPDDIERMEKAIEDCERVDLNEW